METFGKLWVGGKVGKKLLFYYIFNSCFCRGNHRDLPISMVKTPGRGCLKFFDEFFWEVYLGLWENLGGSLFLCFITFLWPNCFEKIGGTWGAPSSPLPCASTTKAHQSQLDPLAPSWKRHLCCRCEVQRCVGWRGGSTCTAQGRRESRPRRCREPWK